MICLSDSKGIYRKLKSKAVGIKSNSISGYIKRPTFNLSGNRELFAEGKISVEKYGDTEIVMCINGMTVSVSGRGLEMCFYNRYTVKLSGFITGICFDNVPGDAL
ncbi:MAG: YabP/YqfC family sporulation protein [Clostridia bacterium]|nr:YabP/YqfC family sporulation protein [Clostridia bacterium]